jgi:quercetin dioxygenase-like cupin family protein
MTTKGVVVPAGGGKHLEESSGQVMAMKLFGRETGQSVTLFEQTVPAGSKNSWLHLHRDSDEVAWVLEGEFTFKIGDEVFSGGPGTCAFLPRKVPHAWKNNGPGTGRAVFLYTPGNAGRLIEERIGREQPPFGAGGMRELALVVESQRGERQGRQVQEKQAEIEGRGSPDA